jgi:uncharacterized protein (TIGR02598 family)
LKPCIKWSEGEGKQAGGFSLIELTIALGIVGFALVAILGLVPIGMKAFQDAMRLNAEAEIVQTIARELENTPWKRTADIGLPTNPPNGLKDYLDSFPIYFDDEGREVGSGATPPTDKAATYAVTVLLDESKVQGSSVVAVGSGNVPLLYTARVFIAYRKVNDIQSRVNTGTIAPNDRQWIKEYPVILSYKGF